jgi:uncharacterized protein YndB with AHSA1/START domain
MTGADQPDGHIIALKGRKVLRYVRHIDRPVEKVWAALTIPERVADWLGKAVIEPRVGGAYTITFGDDHSTATGTIQEFDPPRRLAYTWGDDLDAEHPGVVFELEPDGDGCRLTLMTQFGSGHGGDPADPLATWHEFLLAIPYACDGVRLPWDDARRGRWNTLLEPYRAILKDAGLPYEKP